MVVSVKEYAGPYLIGCIFLDTLDVVLEVVVGIVVGKVIVTVLEDDQYLVAVKELAQQSSVLIVVISSADYPLHYVL